MTEKIDKQSLLRCLPSTDALLSDDQGQVLIEKFGREPCTAVFRESLDDLRRLILKSKLTDKDQVNPASVIAAASKILSRRSQARTRRVINATGVILHTGLGRAPLAESVQTALQSELKHYTAVEVDLESGQRGRRDQNVERLICQLTGAEAATVVNNNAAATVLVLSALASGQEVVISRGQLVEIGGSFRMPDVMVQSGCHLKEVGSTNKTRLSDYEKALGENTGLIMKAHTSNYKITGFTSSVPLEELVSLGKQHQIPVYDDIGSGLLTDAGHSALSDEPSVLTAVKSGADVVSFSGDKLLGGPQSGVIVGKRETIEKIRAHPLYRAFRLGKMTLVALEATLNLYQKNPDLIPFWQMLNKSDEQIKQDAEDLAASLNQIPDLSAECLPGKSQIGSGSAPGVQIPSTVLKIKHQKQSAHQMASALRQFEIPILTRVHDQSLWIDPRTISDDEAEILSKAFFSI